MKDSAVNKGILKDDGFHLGKLALLPVVVFLALTGCSTPSGTAAANQPVRTSQAYLQQSSNLPEDINGDDDPDYEWFY
jgi:hypothetical protein